jgi:hypothetical protein
VLTDKDLDMVDGRLDRLPGLLRGKYGYTREQAEKEIDLFLRDMKPEGTNPDEEVRETLASGPYTVVISSRDEGSEGEYPGLGCLRRNFQEQCILPICLSVCHPKHLYIVLGIGAISTKTVETFLRLELPCPALISSLRQFSAVIS